MLPPGKLATSMKAFIVTANAMQQADAAIAIERYCQQLELIVYAAIRSATIILPPGSIIVAGSSGPSANVDPIELTNVII